jgi:hypothetical protein
VQNALNFKNTAVINTVVTGQEIKFANQSVLNGKKVKTIIATIPAAGQKTINGKDISSNLENVYLVLVDSKNSKIHEGLPLTLLDPIKNGANGPVWLDTAQIDWTKSTLYFADDTQAQANKGKEISLLVVFE